MRPEIFVSSMALAVTLLSLLAWRWRVKISISIYSGIIIGALAAAAVNLIDWAFGYFNIMVTMCLVLAFMFFITFLVIIIRFYRDPERFPLETKNVILSPADGQVIYIRQVEIGSSLVSTKGERRYRLDEIMTTDLVADAAYLVGIDMNILNVHVNRSPITGKIILQKRTRGKFISLRNQESEIVNERVTTVISDGLLKVGVVQLASRLVRSIVSYRKEGDILQIGQRIGAIVFGSQVDLAIPGLKTLELAVRLGDEVKAGVSVIARYDGLGKEK